MGNVVGCCCYREHDKDLEPADLQLCQLLSGAQPPTVTEPPGPMPDLQEGVHQWLLKAAGSPRGGRLGAGAPTQAGEDRAGIARPSRCDLSKDTPSERGLVEPQLTSDLDRRVAAVDIVACTTAAETASLALASVARSSKPEEGKASWAELDTVLGDLNAAMAALMGPDDVGGHRNTVEEEVARDIHPAGSPRLTCDVEQKTGTQEGRLSEADVFETNSSDDDVHELGESLYATTEDGQSTLQEFSGAEETLPPSGRPSPIKARVDAAAAAATGDSELRTTAATWAADRGLALEGGGLEEMYKYF
eukprot:CAMPEP_0115443868 /NCGR_PEP_ID=MMETSP0271-20121206/38093_1 /TAXON_ID=71861 /ORGANISM="Scrippsiella trochoidea, Strain CCMP3099" /LENGTH=304 /DNA_ID=CAMNT_0002869763 /DNA_START=47 /DNA_END=961 /DNA_ORIENTATION=-